MKLCRAPRPHSAFSFRLKSFKIFNSTFWKRLHSKNSRAPLVLAPFFSPLCPSAAAGALPSAALLLTNDILINCHFLFWPASSSKYFGGMVSFLRYHTPLSLVKSHIHDPSPPPPPPQLCKSLKTTCWPEETWREIATLLKVRRAQIHVQLAWWTALCNVDKAEFLTV